MFNNCKKNIVILLVLSLLGFIFSCFHLRSKIGLSIIKLSPTLTIGFILSFILISIPRSSTGVNVFTLISISLIPLSCFYMFLVWHMKNPILNAGGEFSLPITHYGYILTLATSLLATVLYAIGLLKNTK